jgi:hypothetical protein
VQDNATATFVATDKISVKVVPTGTPSGKPIGWVLNFG